MPYLKISTLFVLLLGASQPQAGLVRYNILMPATPGTPDATGFMIFETPPGAGNIMPLIVDWAFHEPNYGGITFSPENSVADTTGQFLVDNTGHYVSHDLLCFGPPTACDGAFALGVFMASSSSIFSYPGGIPIVLYGRPAFSAPITVPSPAISTLFMAGLFGLHFARKRVKQPLRRKD